MLSAIFPLPANEGGQLCANRSRNLVRRLSEMGIRVVTAESLTGGMIASCLASVPGASAVLWGGFVTYCEEAKRSVLGVPAHIIQQYGVVSEETAIAMAEGALNASGANLAVAVTGVAGPGRNQGDPPVGTVKIAVIRTGSQGNMARKTSNLFLTGDRGTIRAGTVKAALRLIDDCLDRQ